MASLEAAEGRWVGDNYRVTWPVTGIQADYDRFHYTNAGITASVVFRRIEGGTTYLLTRTRYNLETSDRIGPIIQRLATQASGKSHLAGVPWGIVLEAAGALALNAFRTGTPAIKASTIAIPDVPRYFLKPYVGRDRPTTLSAGGGTGKTFFAIAAAITAAQNIRDIVGWKNAPPCNVLFLDWEGTAPTFWKRVLALLIGNGVDESAIRDRLFYRNLKGVPLVEAGSSLSREVEDLDIGFIVADSLFYATGGQLTDAKAVGDCYDTAGKLRRFHQPTGLRLPIPFLFVTHLNKVSLSEDRQAGKRTSPYGTIFIENGSDYLYSMEQPSQTGDVDDEDSGEKYVLLTCEKVNHGRFTKPHAYKMIFTDDPSDPDETMSLEYERLDPLVVPEFASKLPLTTRILGAIRGRGGIAMTPLAIAEAIPGGMPDMADADGPDDEKRIEKERTEFRSKVRVGIARLRDRGMLVKIGDAYGIAAGRTR